ncbi:reverse transcriptase domain-containing protein [Tanacetum coccineum]
MDDPNITIEEYIRLEEEKARKRAIVFDDVLTSKVTPFYKPTVSPLNDNKIDFRISLDESDDEDYTVIYDENSFSYKIISVNDLKTDSENDNDKVNMPSFPSPEPTVSYSNDLDFFKDFENGFPAIVYNDGLTSKSDSLTEPTISPQHIDEFNLKDETSLSKFDEEEQNVLYFNNLFPFIVIYPDDSKLDKDNDDDKIDIEHSSGDLSIKPLPNEPSEQNHNIGGVFINLEISKCWSLENTKMPVQHTFCSNTQNGESSGANHQGIIIKPLVKKKQKGAILELKRRHLKKVQNYINTPYPERRYGVLVEVLKEKSIQEREVAIVVEEDGPTWMTPIMEYLKDRTLSYDRKEARTRKGQVFDSHYGLFYEVDRGKSCGDNQRQSGKEVRVGQHSVPLRCSRRDSLKQRSLGEGIKARLGEGKKKWIEELLHVLWAHHTMIKLSHDDTPFSLTYRTEAIIPVDIGMPMYRTAVVDAVHNDEELRLNLYLLEERRERAAIHEAKAKLKMTKYYNARVRGVTFRPRDFVYHSNDASHVVDAGKLGPKWEGPYEVTEALVDEAHRLRSMKGTVLPRM